MYKCTAPQGGYLYNEYSLPEGERVCLRVEGHGQLYGLDLVPPFLPAAPCSTHILTTLLRLHYCTKKSEKVNLFKKKIPIFFWGGGKKNMDVSYLGTKK